MSYCHWFVDSLKSYWILKLLSTDDGKIVPSHEAKKTPQDSLAYLLPIENGIN